MKLLASRDYAWDLHQTDAGALLLSVLCGTIAMYTITIELNAGERRRYAEEGEKYIGVLANRIVSHPDSYGDRHRQQLT